MVAPSPFRTFAQAEAEAVAGRASATAGNVNGSPGSSGSGGSAEGEEGESKTEEMQVDSELGQARGEAEGIAGRLERG